MAHVIHETRPAEDRRVVVDDRRGITSSAAQIVYVIASIVLSLLAVRLLLALLGANPNNVFANFIYTITQPLVAPFFGLFNYSGTLGVSRFEYETLIAIAVYGLLAWILATILGGRREYVD